MAKNPYLLHLIIFGIGLILFSFICIYHLTSTNDNNLSKDKCINNAYKKHNYSCFTWDSIQSKCLDGSYDSNLVCVPLSSGMPFHTLLGLVINIICFFYYLVSYIKWNNGIRIL